MICIARTFGAPEVDEHDVLGPVLLRAEEPLRVPGAGARRSGDRVHARAPAFELDEGLGRGADERELLELQEEEVRRGVDAAERAVEVERRGGRAPLGPL